jgi:hypothetical protein
MTDNDREKGDSREERAALKATTREWHRVVEEETNVLTVIKQMSSDIRAHNPPDAFLDLPLDDLDVNVHEDKVLKDPCVRLGHGCALVLGLPISFTFLYFALTFTYCLNAGCLAEINNHYFLPLQWLALYALKHVHWVVIVGFCFVIAIFFTWRIYARERATRAALFEELANIGPDDLVMPLNEKRYAVELTQLAMAGGHAISKPATTVYRFVLGVHLATYPPTKQLTKRKCRRMRDCIPWS